MALLDGRYMLFYDIHIVYTSTWWDHEEQIPVKSGTKFKIIIHNRH